MHKWHSYIGIHWTVPTCRNTNGRLDSNNKKILQDAGAFRHLCRAFLSIGVCQDTAHTLHTVLGMHSCLIPIHLLYSIPNNTQYKTIPWSHTTHNTHLDLKKVSAKYCIERAGRKEGRNRMPACGSVQLVRHIHSIRQRQVRSPLQRCRRFRYVRTSVVGGPRSLARVRSRGRWWARASWTFLSSSFTTTTTRTFFVRSFDNIISTVTKQIDRFYSSSSFLFPFSIISFSHW